MRNTRRALGEPLLEEAGADGSLRSSTPGGKHGIILLSLLIGFGCAILRETVVRAHSSGVLDMAAMAEVPVVPESATLTGGASLPPPSTITSDVAPVSGGEKFTHVASRESMSAVKKTEIDGLAEQAVKKDTAKEALLGIQKAAQDKSAAAEPFLITAFSQVMEASKLKGKDIQEAAVKAGVAVIDGMSPFAVDLILPAILRGLDQQAPTSTKLAVCKWLNAIAHKAPKAIGYLLVQLVIPVADLTCEVDPKIVDAGLDCFGTICSHTGNRDLEPFLPYVTQAASSITNTHSCVERLAGCIFVQNVQTPALASMIPVLSRGLKDKNEEVMRTCSKIVDNMCKVVDDPAEILPVMALMEPLMIHATEKIANPEARGVAEKALKTLRKAAEGAVKSKISRDDAVAIIKRHLGDQAEAGEAFEEVMNHIAGCAATATNMRDFDPEGWKAFAAIPPFNSIIDKVRLEMEVAAKPAAEVEEADDEGVDLYRGSFSLAYGTLTLLRDAKLHLKRDRFYGLLGPNQCGKTTLMRAIANEQLDGFPKRDELKSVFVEHEIADEEVGVQDDGFPILSVDKPGWWWVMHTVNDVYKVEKKATEEQVKTLMKDIGFGYTGGPERAANLENPVTTYSGGWKMKMQLCAAQLMNADVLMLDEPTGHLDTDNILWLENWLESFSGSIITTSHFSPFLDKMCTHIIDFNDRKLITFKGEKGKTLTQFVEKYPEKKAYFEIPKDAFKFVFPAPGALEGAKTRSKIVLRLNDISFQYPSKDAPTITNVSLTVSQLSRVAVIGANGAGKSTAIKVLVGEEIPTYGTVWKAPGMRMAYVAQHAFHHLEKHMQETPTAYIGWRFAGNDDKESIDFKSSDLSIDEAKARNQSWMIDTTTGFMRRCMDPKQDPKKAKAEAAMALVPESILARRWVKKEKVYEYEVKFVMKTMDSNTFIEKDVLIAMGYKKMIERQDEKEAAAAGLQSKQLTAKGIEKHLQDFGVDPESASHTQINQLSGGMKVKVVLAAAMWQNPHILILDEPTNYLDREGLGALVLAIQEYKGGVLIISHNKEFCDGVATEKWIMKGGKLRIEGGAVEDADEPTGLAAKLAANAEVFDSLGNKIEVKEVLDDKAKKKRIKDIERKLKDNAKKQLLPDEQVWELEDELTKLKEETAKE